jgi:hypothetical protein
LVDVTGRHSERDIQIVFAPGTQLDHLVGVLIGLPFYPPR